MPWDGHDETQESREVSLNENHSVPWDCPDETRESREVETKMIWCLEIALTKLENVEKWV